MALENILFVAALLSLAVNIVISIGIVSYIQQQGEKVNFFLIRLLLPKYVYRYKQITQERTGRAGKPFYVWIVTINLALVLGVAGILVKNL
jgi:hypothetical protein